MDKLYSRAEAAKALGVSVSTIDRAKAAGTISFCQESVNGRILFPEAALRQFVARHMNKAKPKNPRGTNGKQKWR